MHGWEAKMRLVGDELHVLVTRERLNSINDGILKLKAVLLESVSE